MTSRSLRVVATAPLAFVAFAGLVGAACSRSPEPHRGAPPPPPPVVKPAACAGGGGTLSDATSAPFLPRVASTFCLDPNGGDKSFGDGASLPLTGICDAFDGECEVYRGYGVRRVLEARYIDGAGSPATVDVYLSKFATAEGAYAMFTKRVVGDGDPASDAMPRAIDGGAAAALGLGNAYLYRGQYLVELTYNNVNAAERATKETTDRLLPPLVKQIGDKLPGDPGAPPAAAALPRDELLPLGVSYASKDVLGIDGAGPGAIGYYRAGATRYRIASLVRPDLDQAKDLVSTLAKVGGASKEKGIGDGAVRLTTHGTEWIFGRFKKSVIGVGDDIDAPPGGPERKRLSKDEKIERLKNAGASLGG